MEQRLLFNFMLMIVSIGILLKILDFFVGTTGKRSHVNFLGYAHWFM